MKNEMATFDDKQWLLNHIHNSFVTSDDTGLCEMVILPNDCICRVPQIFPFEGELKFDTSENSDEERTQHSPDIAPDMDFIGHRHRSYTAQRLDKMKKEKRNAAKVKRFTWRHTNRELTESELTEMFCQLTVDSADTYHDSHPRPPKVSLLSQLLQQFPAGLNNPFVEFSKFDGMTHTNAPSQRINVFVLVNSSSCPYPLPVSVVSTARISDLIGLVCYLHTKENLQPPLQTKCDQYALHIAEEDGQVDWDFQALPKRDLVHKFGFKTLALVNDTVEELPDFAGGIVVTLNVADGGFSKCYVENNEITLREILQRTISKRKDMAKIVEKGIEYHLEKETEPGVILSLDTRLSEVNCFEFAVVRDNSKRSTMQVDTTISAVSAVSASLYNSYKVTWILNFVKWRTVLGMSGDKVEIQPLHPKGGGSFLAIRSPQSVSFGIECVVECICRSEKKGRMEVRLTVQGEHRFKNYLFECDSNVGREILQRFKVLFEMHSGSHSHEEKKFIRRRNSLSFMKRPIFNSRVKEV